MRLKPIVSLALLPLAMLVTGCGLTSQDQIATNAPGAAISGVVHGGQSPIVGATIAVYAVGTGGYGTAATFMASTTTDSNGSFSFSSGSYTCPQSNTPMYILSIGGNPGAGTNSSSVLGAPLGQCLPARSRSLVINEVTTISLAYSMAQFFTTTYGASSFTGATPADSFSGIGSTSGGVTTYPQGIVLADDFTSKILVNNSYGGANGAGTVGTVNYVVETAKIYTLANILATCVNSTGSTGTGETGTPCGRLFNWTKNGHTPRPSDTLQAAVSMALHPTVQIANLFGSAGSTPPFAGGLATQPNDFSLAVSYTDSRYGLAVPTNSVSTIDIDQNNHIWFTSNASGQVGLSYYDPFAEGFNGPYNTTAMVNPTQVAIDNAGFAWANDYGSSVVSGYNVNSPASATSYSQIGTTSTALTIGDDNRVNVGTYSGSVSNISNVSQDRSTYAAQASPISGARIVSMAGDSVGGEAVVTQASSGVGSNGYYVAPNASVTSVFTNASYTGQVIFSGNDFLELQQGKGTGTAGMCIYSATTCYSLSSAAGQSPTTAVVDGAGTLWYTEPGAAGVFITPITTPANSGGSVYLNATPKVNAALNVLHGNGNSNTIVNPMGIAVDLEGNVWLSNAGCTTTGCTPGAFTLSEIVGAAAPTVVPVAYNITQGSVTTGSKPQY